MYNPEKERLTGKLISEIRQLVDVIMDPKTNDLGRMNALGPMYETKLVQLKKLKPDLNVKDFL
jgi:hypothetical protein